MKNTHLRYWLQHASENGIEVHPQQEMKRLGITYCHATPQSIGDQWWFWNCENIPETLPKHLEFIDLDPMEFIGFGLSEDQALTIMDYKIESL